MLVISVFFGIIIRMYYDDHNPPHIHAEYQGHKALLDLRGNILKGDLKSRTALKLVRDWIDFRYEELIEDWELARKGEEMKKIWLNPNFSNSHIVIEPCVYESLSVFTMYEILQEFAQGYRHPQRLKKSCLKRPVKTESHLHGFSSF